MKFSIITAVYNRNATIGQALDSVAQQSYGDIEHLVVNGVSTDGTLDVVNARHHSGMQVISEPDDGIYDALNKGVTAAAGDVIGIMHSDDFFAHEGVLDSVAKSFAQTGADAVYGDLDYVSARDPDKIVRHWQSGSYDRQKLVRGWMPPHPAFYMRRKYYEELGGFDLQYQIAADYDSMVRYLWKHQLKAAYIPKVLMMMRTGGVSNRNLKNIIQKSKEDWSVMRNNGLGLRCLLWKNLSKIPQFFRR